MHVVATAGHVDHGKSTLVRALTGMEPDRWAEERRRGMTIDLGYAWTELPTGETVAFVDVPGHQRFIGNMLAGVGPAPAVVFVVAADEGWSRQSAEHLAALDALSVGHGVLVITRSDLADPLAAQEESLRHIARTSLGVVPAVAVSAVTGAGLDELRRELSAMLGTLPIPPPTERVRLWVDRAFTIKGAGTVVTGTLQGGVLTTGGQLTLASTGGHVRLRGLEMLGERCTHATAVARVAVNVAGTTTAIDRGDALLSAGHWHMTAETDVRLTGGTTAAQLPRELLLHVGAAAVTARIRPLGDDTVRLLLQHALPLQNGDRGALRDPGKQRIAAGVVVLDAAPPALSRRGAARARAAVLAGITGPDASGEVERRAVVHRGLLVELGCGPPAAGGSVRNVGDWFVSARQWSDWSRGLDDLVDAAHAANPLAAGVPLGAAVTALGVPDREILAAVAAGADGVELRDGMLSRRGRAVEVPAAVRELLAQLDLAPYGAPSAGSLRAAGITAQMLAAAERSGLLVRLGDGVVLTPPAVDAAAAALAVGPQPFGIADAREAIGSSRRVTVALLEHFDHTGRTTRDGAGRRTSS